MFIRIAIAFSVSALYNPAVNAQRISPESFGFSGVSDVETVGFAKDRSEHFETAMGRIAVRISRRTTAINFSFITMLLYFAQKNK